MGTRRTVSRLPYHHGDLHRALLEAGRALVEEGGLDAVSLRAVARRAGVSHAAPYHHFRGKSDLLAAIAGNGFQRLVETIESEAPREQPADRWGPLRAVGRGYVRFASEHPSVFRLMFRPELTRPSEHPQLMQAEALAFGALQRALQLGLGSSGEPTVDLRWLAAFAWSTVHGLALLHIDHVLQETPIGAIDWEQLAHHVNETVVQAVRGSLSEKP